jgi:geranylgeranyl diphosphate synthase type II
MSVYPVQIAARHERSALHEYLESRRRLVEEALDRFLPPAAETPTELHEGMRYAIFAGGKRLRPILAVAAAEATGGWTDCALPVAVALECIHTYSLVHDDLPAMDDDDLRRGKPTCHKVFGEAIAILVGDGLLSFAFELLGSQRLMERIGAERTCALVREVAQAVGSRGMVGGQAIDILSEGKRIDHQTLVALHTRKTGALLRASVVAGAMAANAQPQVIELLRGFGDKIGLAFQIVDDILDVTQPTEILGKPAKSDLKLDKSTYVTALGLEEARRAADRLIQEARESLAPLGERGRVLMAIADYVAGRES